MEHCESKTGGACMRPATWEQSVRAGDRDAGRLLYHSYWCDEHAERVAAQRRQDRMAAPTMMRTVHEAP